MRSGKSIGEAVDLPVLAACDHPCCPHRATVKLDINGRLCFSCETHVSEVVRAVSEPSFEAMGVSA